MPLLLGPGSKACPQPKGLGTERGQPGSGCHSINLLQFPHKHSSSYLSQGGAGSNKEPKYGWVGNNREWGALEEPSRGIQLQALCSPVLLP